MTRFDPKAIFTALLLSLVLDLVGGVLLVMVFGVGLGADTTPEEAEAAVQAALQHTGFLLTSAAYGIATTVFAGHVAARMARAYPYFNALAVGVIGLALGLLLSSDAPWWYDALALLLSVPAAVLGGHLAVRRRNH